MSVVAKPNVDTYKLYEDSFTKALWLIEHDYHGGSPLWALAEKLFNKELDLIYKDCPEYRPTEDFHSYFRNGGLGEDELLKPLEQRFTFGRN